MFSCCLGISREGGSDLRKEKSGGPGGGCDGGRGGDHGGSRGRSRGGGRGGAWRRRAHSWLQGLWPFGRKDTSLSQCSKVQNHTDLLGEESAPKVLKEFHRFPHFSSLEETLTYLVICMRDGETGFVLGFLCMYRRFITTQQVLDLLFKRYSAFHPDCEEDEQVKNTICALLDYWIDKLPEEFCKTEHLPLLKQVKTYLIVNMPYSDLLVRVHNLQTQLQAEVAIDSEDSDEEASG